MLGINQLSNIDHIVKNDLFLDSYIGITSDSYGLSGRVENFNTFTGTIEEGRMPESENETILEVPKAYGNMKDNVLNKEFTLSSNGMESLLEGKLLIVGIAYYEPTNSYYSKIYLKEDQLNEVRKKLNISSSSIEVTLNDNILNCSTYGGKYRIVPSKLVPEGKAIVPEELNYLCKYNNCRNYDMKINVSSIYFDSELTVKISNTFNKNNIKRLLKMEEYQRYSQAIFINEAQYYEMYNKGIYQSSVFVKDVKQIDTTINELQNLGYKALPLKDTLINYDGVSVVVGKAFLIVVTVIVILALFFISYFVIKIILKSRNIYYSTIRILGATRKNAKEILQIELLNILNLSYVLILAFIYLVKNSYIQIAFIANLITYIQIRDYIILYFILLVISLLISNRYARQLFKKSAMNTYREEV